MSAPAISVIIPIYNVAEFLPQCLDSLLAQTFGGWEALLIDDGSPDNSADICREYCEKDPRFSYHRQENGGLSAARNTGIGLAAGEHLFFLDSDDTIPQNALKLLYDTAQEYDAEIVCGQHMECFSEPESIPVADGSPVCFIGDEVKQNLFHPLVTLFASGKLYRRDLFASIRYPVGKRFEDAFTTPRLLFSAHRVVLIQQVVYCYFQRPGSITHAPCADYYEDWTQAFAACERLAAEQCPAILPQAHSRYLLSYLRTLDLLLCWPGWRKSETARRCVAFTRQNLAQLLRDSYLRLPRKVYALGVTLAPDAVSLALRSRRRRQERAYRTAQKKEMAL